MTDEKLKEEMKDYAEKFCGERFPEGLPGEIKAIVYNIVFDAFEDGARWADENRETSKIIIPGS